MANSKGRRRRFGSVRKLPSGRFQARYRGPDGLMRTADATFATQTDADRRLVKQEAKILDGDWKNPDVKIAFGDFAASWFKDRDYAATTRELMQRMATRRCGPRWSISTSSTATTTRSPTTWTVRSGRCGGLPATHLARKWHGGPEQPKKIKAQASGFTPADLGLVRVLRLVGADDFEPPTSAL
jgi:hypothetical protein